LDWNSFFSTISQASASMIGVILAFLVSRIISEGSDYDRLVYDSSVLIDESIDLKARLDSMNFDWHDKKIFEDFDFRDIQENLNDLMDSGHESKVELLRQALPRLYYPEKFVDELDKKIKYGDPMRDLPVVGRSMIVTGIREHINAFESEFDNISLRVQSVVRRHKIISRAFSSNILDMKSLSSAIIVLVPITFMTVIYPLHFLPVSDGAIPSIEFNILAFLRLLISIKGFFLVVLSALTVGLLLFLAWHCKRHVSEYRRRSRVINETYINLNWYSDLIGEYNPLLLHPDDPFQTPKD
jgi:hypothetical protein